MAILGAGIGYFVSHILSSRKVGNLEKKAEELLETMENFGVTELPQDRLERMFAYYNNNWKYYYGTEKIFDIQ